MEQQTNDQAAPEPGRKRRRRRRPNGRWTQPASLLQAARFARRASGREIVNAFRELCPGHAGRKCKMDVSKLSDYENRARRPSVDHIETFCRLYQKSAEELGLITWRDDPAAQPEAARPTNRALEPRDRDTEQHLVDWLRDSAVSIATAVVQALTRFPNTLTEEDLRGVIGALLPEAQDASEDEVPDGDPSDVPPPVDTTTQPSHPARAAPA